MRGATLLIPAPQQAIIIGMPCYLLLVLASAGLAMRVRHRRPPDSAQQRQGPATAVTMRFGAVMLLGISGMLALQLITPHTQSGAALHRSALFGLLGLIGLGLALDSVSGLRTARGARTPITAGPYFDAARRIAARAGMVAPALWLAQSPTANAFATLRSGVVLTAGLLEKLPNDEVGPSPRTRSAISRAATRAAPWPSACACSRLSSLRSYCCSTDWPATCRSAGCR